MNSDILQLLGTVLGNFLFYYSILLIVRILLSWFQGADWAYQIISFLSPITDPYLNIFRSFIPPLGGMDFSPILAIFLLQILQSLVASFAGQSTPSVF